MQTIGKASLDKFSILRSETLLRDLAYKADACERSISVTPEMIEDRVLFFFDLLPERSQMLADLAKLLQVPDHLIRAWANALPGADAIGLALRTDGASVRLYTQYWDLLCAHLEAGLSDLPPLYLGFKALPDSSIRTDSYHVLPEAPRSLFWPRMYDMFSALGLDEHLAQTAFAPLDADTCIWTETRSEKRKSWLATVRRAELDRHNVATALEPLQDTPAHQVADLARNHKLVHIASGEDTAKGQFTTFYFETSPNLALEALAIASPSHDN